MKNTQRTSVPGAVALHSMARMRIILVLLTVIALAMAGCDDGNGNSTHVHQWGAWNVTTPATCIATGSQTRTCVLDATHTETQEIAIDLVNGHDWDFDNATETVVPTCTATGSGTADCKRNGCNETNSGTDNIPALGHTYDDGDWQVTEAATCSATGEEEAKCVRYTECGYTGTRETPVDLVNGHDYQLVSTATETADGEEGMVCTRNNLHKGSTTIAYATGTAGLTYVALGSSPNESWGVTRGSASGAIAIPAYRRSDPDSPYLPVTRVGGITNSATSNAFGGTSSSPNTTVTSITFTEGSRLTEISNYAFYYCRNLASITIPETVTSIGTYAFESCISLTGSLTIPAGVTQIRTNTFYNCRFTSVTILGNVTTIDNMAFYGCTTLTDITLPATVTSIGQSAFNSCLILPSITIPASVTSIGEDAFSLCNSLTSVTFAGTIASSGVNANAFRDMGDLRAKYLNTISGGPGTYTTTTPVNAGSVWTKQ